MLAFPIRPRLLERVDFPPSLPDLRFEFVDLVTEPMQFDLCGFGRLPLALLVAFAVAQCRQSIARGLDALPQIAVAIGTVDVQKTGHRRAGLFKCRNTAAVLFQVLQGLGGLGQGLFGQLRQRVDEMRRQVQVDAVADARMTHNVDELDVLIDRRPVE